MSKGASYVVKRFDISPKKHVARDTTPQGWEIAYMEKEPTDDKAKVTLRDLKVVRDVKGGYGHVIERRMRPRKGETKPNSGGDEEDEKPTPDN
jgi:hypothetical protein